MYLLGLHLIDVVLIAIYPRVRRMVGAWMRRLVPECALAGPT